MKNLLTAAITITLVLASTSANAKEEAKDNTDAKRCQKECTIQWKVPQGSPRAPKGIIRGSGTR